MAGVITALKMQKRDKERVNVYVDGEFAFAVTALVAVSLKKGQQLSDKEIEQLKSQDERAKAYSHAVRYLGFRVRSQAEMVNYLKGKGYSAQVVDDTVNRLLDEKYLDDEVFAQTWLENRETLRPRGQRFLRYELKQKGIADSVIDATLGELDEEESAWRAVESKAYRWQNLPEEEFKKKVMSFLSRRGFGYEVVRDTTQRAWAALNSSE
jgi:regulatory protein